MIIPRAARLGPGYTPITNVGGSGSEARMDFGLLRLGGGEEFSESSRRERVFLLLHGAALLEWDGGEERVQRASMVEEPPTALHLPGGTRVSIQSVGEHTELAVAGVENARGFAPLFIPPSRVGAGEIGVPGAEGTADRVLRTVFDDSSAPYSNLAIGEVVTRPGRWSSYPPHHHPHPEIYHYRFFPSGGFGYCGHGSEVHRVRDEDTAVIEPGASHPQVAAPGYAMIYVWVIRHLDGNRFGAESRIYEPEHTWVLED